MSRRKFSKFGKNFLLAPKSLWILFKVGQTRLGHSWGEWRKKVGPNQKGGRKDTYFLENFLSVELNLAQLITFFLLIFMRRNLVIRNQREKLHRISSMSKNNSTKNLTRNFLAELFWVRQNFRKILSSSDFFADSLKRCAIKNEYDMQSLKTIGQADQKK